MLHESQCLHALRFAGVEAKAMAATSAAACSALNGTRCANLSEALGAARRRSDPLQPARRLRIELSQLMAAVTHYYRVSHRRRRRQVEFQEIKQR